MGVRPSRTIAARGSRFRGLALLLLAIPIVAGCAGSPDALPGATAGPPADSPSILPPENAASGLPPDILRHCIGRHNSLRQHNPAALTPEAIGYRFDASLGGWHQIRFSDIRSVTAIKARLRRQDWRGYLVVVGSETSCIPLFVEAEDKTRFIEALVLRASENGSSLSVSPSPPTTVGMFPSEQAAAATPGRI